MGPPAQPRLVIPEAASPLWASRAPWHSRPLLAQGQWEKDLNCLPAAATFLTSLFLYPSNPSDLFLLVLSSLLPVVIVRRE